jgi:ribosomal protein L11 methylase PrmA
MPQEDYTQDFYARQREGALRSAQSVVPRLLRVIKPKSVIDVGCGLGVWLKAFRENGVEDIEGLDGAHVDRSTLAIPSEQFHAHDLRQPIQGVGL